MRLQILVHVAVIISFSSLETLPAANGKIDQKMMKNASLPIWYQKISEITRMLVFPLPGRTQPCDWRLNEHAMLRRTNPALFSNVHVSI